MGMGRTVGSWSGKVLGKERINKTYLERGRGETSGKNIDVVESQEVSANWWEECC